jgi:hypothetical protein
MCSPIPKPNPSIRSSSSIQAVAAPPLFASSHPHISFFYDLFILFIQMEKITNISFVYRLQDKLFTNAHPFVLSSNEIIFELKIFFGVCLVRKNHKWHKNTDDEIPKMVTGI